MRYADIGALVGEAVASPLFCNVDTYQCYVFSLDLPRSRQRRVTNAASETGGIYFSGPIIQGEKVQLHQACSESSPFERFMAAGPSAYKRPLTFVLSPTGLYSLDGLVLGSARPQLDPAVF